MMCLGNLQHRGGDREGAWGPTAARPPIRSRHCRSNPELKTASSPAVLAGGHVGG